MSDAPRRRPTDMAKTFFNHAANTAFPGILQRNGLAPKEQADVLHKIAAGLYELATGLRATYILLAEVKELLQRQNQQPGQPTGMAGIAKIISDGMK